LVCGPAGWSGLRRLRSGIKTSAAARCLGALVLFSLPAVAGRSDVFYVKESHS